MALQSVHVLGSRLCPNPNPPTSPGSTHLGGLQPLFALYTTYTPRSLKKQVGQTKDMALDTSCHPPPFALAPPCLSTGWVLNCYDSEFLGPLFLWSQM